MNEYSLLSRPEILRHYFAGNIAIDPFDPESVGTNSYDVTLGEYVWRENLPGPEDEFGIDFLYNPYVEEAVTKLWKLDRAKPALEVFDGIIPKGINKDDKVIFIGPSESILAHTIEFIGGLSNNITTKMFARSSAGRNFLQVCACAGLGDIEFHNRWTMEIFNRSTQYTLPLVVGRRYAQISFFQTEPLLDEGYSCRGKYQKYAGLEEIKATWKPEDMLPRMYLDREIKHV